jgi:chromosomal replication initiation ATPase DnaA
MRAVFNIEWNKHVPLSTRKIIIDSIIIESIRDAIKIATDKDFSYYDVKCRKRNIVILRFAFFKLARTYSSLTYDDIGSLFSCKFDHSTIIHGCETIDSIQYMGGRDERFNTWSSINNTFKKIIKNK